MVSLVKDSLPKNSGADLTRPCCHNCPLYERESELLGKCNLLPRSTSITGFIPNALKQPDPSKPITVTLAVYMPPEGVCLFHPRVLHVAVKGVVQAACEAWFESAKWDQERGFTGPAPSLRSAKDFAPPFDASKPPGADEVKS